MDVKARREDMDSSLASRAAITEYLRASSLRRRRGNGGPLLHRAAEDSKIRRTAFTPSLGTRLK
jgi:hypothetical protein